MATSSLASQSTPIAGARLDRTAAHAAVRNLAESYGVDLLPLDLSPMAGLDAPTPVNVNVQRRCSEPGGPPQRQLRNVADIPTSPCGANAAAPAGPEVVITPRQRCCHAEIVTTCSPRKAAAAAESDAIAAAGVDNGGAAAAAGGGADAEQAWLDSSCPDECVADADEREYLEHDLTLEQRISLLEEERDILVDKLLATTEALHASEARNRQSQASASQVGALLNQLQELLRRAEVERDRAKLQLKRQRASTSQPTAKHSDSAVVARLAAAPLLAQCMSAPLQVTANKTLCGSSSTGEGSSRSSDAAASQPEVSEQLRHRKKHKSSSEDGVLGQAAVTLSDSSTAERSDATAAAAGIGASVKAALGCGSIIGRRRRGSSGSSAAETAAAAAAAAALRIASGDPPSSPGTEQLESPVTLTPSSNEVRPPVKSVINGFEALMKQRARAAAAKAAAARAAAAKAAAAAAAAAAAPAGFVAAAVASREAEVASPSKLQAVAAATAEAAAAAAGAEAAGAEAAGVYAGLIVQVPHIRVDRVRSEDGCSSSATAAAAAGRPVGSSVGSEVSTPTAAAVCNASPARFRAELLSLDDGMSESELITSSDDMGPSYADVVCRHTSREWSTGSSRAASKSPLPTRPVQHTAAHGSKDQPKQQQQQDEDAGGTPQPLQERAAAAAAAASSTMPSAAAGVSFSFGHSSDGSSSSSKKGRGASPVRSPKAGAASPTGALHSPRCTASTSGSKAPNTSRLGCAAAAAGSAGPASAVAAAIAEAAMVKQQRRQGVVYNPNVFRADGCSCNVSGGTSAGSAAAPAAAAAAVSVIAAVPVVPDSASSKAAAAPVASNTAAAAAPEGMPSSGADKGQQQQVHKKQQSSCAVTKKQRQQKQWQQHKQADEEQQQQPQLKVEVGRQTADALPAGMSTPGSPADCTAEVVTCDSSNTSSGNSCSTGRGALQKGKQLAAGPAAKAKGALQAAARGSAGQGPLVAASVSKHASSSASQTRTQTGILWKVAVVVLLLVSGGLFAALMFAWQGTQQQSGMTPAGTFDLQQQLEAMQDRVAVLQRQLSERDLQLAMCSGQEAAAAGVAVGTASDSSEL